MDKTQSARVQKKPIINSLKDLRRELKKIDAGIKIQKFTDFRFMTYTYKGEEITGNVFDSADMLRLKPLIDFINNNQEAILQVARDEGLTGAKKFMQRTVYKDLNSNKVFTGKDKIEVEKSKRRNYD